MDTGVIHNQTRRPELQRGNMLTCKYCQHCFKHNSSLIRHMNLHTGTKIRLSCTVCWKSFGRYDNFKRHFRTHGLPFREPTAFHPREEATVPRSYERPTEATGRILQSNTAHGHRFITRSAIVQQPKPKRIPIIILAHRSKTRYYRGLPGRALPKNFPRFPEWHMNMVKTSKIHKDLYCSDEETRGPSTP